MKIDPEIEKEVERIDQNINNTLAAIKSTDDTIARLVRLNDGRKSYLRKLGHRKSELLTFELDFG